ncbi:MAG: pseudouridine synthase [Flavobacteriales bacterium]|nr:pseudouridine synthase [Flavobacteriales bacterium]
MYKLKSKKAKTLPFNVRIETYCRGLFDELPSNKSVKKAVVKGVIRVNGRKIPSSYFVKEGDEIELWDMEIKAPLSYEMKLNVVYEDDYLAIVNKPSGLPTSGNLYRTLENAIQGKLTKAKINPLKWPKPVHRLDVSTSGLVIVAKSIEARVKLGKMLENRSIEKTYEALLSGRLERDTSIEFPIDGKDALTEVFIIDSKKSLNNGCITKVMMKPVTGRTHQLRKHSALIKHPIIGDKEYGEKGNVLLHKGLFLCAVRLRFTHPITAIELDVKIDSPEKFDKLMEREHRRYLKFRGVG